MADRIEIAFCFDDHLALPGAVAILSLLKARSSDVRIHLVGDPDTRAAPLLREMAARHGVEIRILDASAGSVQSFDSTSDYGRPSSATYWRLLLAHLLEDVDRLIYLDADLIVRHDLGALWATELGAAPLAAVTDPWMATIPSTRDEFPEGYFNAGVLLLDLERWREERLSDRCISEIARLQYLAELSGGGPASHQYDQMPLNMAVRGRWHALSPTWNYTSYLTPRLARELDLPPALLAEIQADPAIVHFLGSHKPWVPGFEALSPWHREFDRLRSELEAEFDCRGLPTPGAFTKSAAIARRRRMMAMRLVAQAKAAGFARPAIVLTGLLGQEVLIVAREQHLPIACFVSESPAYLGGAFHGVDVLPIAEAIERGHRDFILGDFRRLDRTRGGVETEARAQGAQLRILDVTGLGGGGREPLAQPASAAC